MRERGVTVLGVVLLVTALSVLAWGENLLERVRELKVRGEYRLAEEILEDRLERGVPQTRPLTWMRAQLTTDPDRFDRLAATLTSGSSSEDSLAQVVMIARAREAFARGRYLTSIELLDALPASARRRNPEATLFAGMASAAVGEVRSARERLLEIDESSEAFAMSRTLLAQLSLRAGDPRGALKEAETALSTGDEDVAVQALYVRAQALEQMGEVDRAQRTREEILRRWSRTAEAAWVREERLHSSTPATSSEGSGISEVESPTLRRSFALQLGAFHDRSLALRLARSMKTQIEELRIERDASSSPPWYRVVGGRFPTRGTAEAAQQELARSGWRTVILTPGRH